MRRREAIVAVAAVGASGCLGGVRSTLGLEENEDPPQPIKPTKPLGQYDCPKFQNRDFDAVKGTICYRGKDDGPNAINYRASKRQAHLPPDLLRFTMKRVGSGPALYVTTESLVTRLTDEGWKLVAPTDGASAEEANPIALRSDESYTWTVGVGGDSPSKEGGQFLRLGDVGPGVYAFRARARVDDGVSEARDINVAHTMLFTVRNKGSSQ